MRNEPGFIANVSARASTKVEKSKLQDPVACQYSMGFGKQLILSKVNQLFVIELHL